VLRLNKTSGTSFRGAVSGFGFAYCDFVRRGGRETVTASVSVAPEVGSAARVSIRRGRKPTARRRSRCRGALAPIEQAGMRSTIAP